MGHFIYKLPDVGEGTAEAEIVKWYVKAGDHVKEDQHLVDVMTDKATVEMTSPVTGKVITLHGNPGEKATVGAPLAEFEVEGAGNATAASAPPQSRPAQARGATAPPKGEHEAVTRPPPLGEAPRGAGRRGPGAAAAPVREREPIAARAPAMETPPAFVSPKVGEKPLASPAVRNRAHELGIELQFVPGTGPAGRITHEDLDNYIATGGRAAAAKTARGYAKREGVEEIKVIGLRRKIAERMQEAKRHIPHFAYVEEVDMTELESLRAHLNENKRPEQPKLTVLPFLMRTLCHVIPEFPQVNARFDDEQGVVTRYAAVHIGIATQTVNGLIVPVVRHAEALDLWSAAAELARLAALTREGKASRDDLVGSTITITSLGALGGVVTTPIINYPEVAIIGPNAIVERPVVHNGHIAVRKMMNLSSCFDHRVVDGYDAAQFIQRV
ncbi:MAG: 2-oxo acid dehydrogenase subunit E2, partial [Alphaproteobacteria bacterium]